MNRTNAARCPRVFERHSMWKTMAEWRQLGLVPQGEGWPADHVLATLLEPDGIGKTAYLLTGNYRVILDYNCSNRSEEHTSELQSLMRISYAVFCLKKKTIESLSNL